MYALLVTEGTDSTLDRISTMGSCKMCIRFVLLFYFLSDHSAFSAEPPTKCSFSMVIEVF